MRNRKLVVWMVPVLLCLCLLGGCKTESSFAYVFDVETGDSIEVRLDTSNGYQLTEEDGQFAVVYQNETVLEGVFIESETYDMFADIVYSQKDGAELLEERDQSGTHYLFYQVDGEAGMEHNFVAMVEDSNTGVLIGSLADAEAAQQAFSRLTFTRK